MITYYLLIHSVAHVGEKYKYKHRTVPTDLAITFT